MAPGALQENDTLQVRSEGGRLVIPVPWRQAEGLQDRLRRKGIGSTLYLVPYTEEARIEVWPGTDAATVQSALDVANN